MDQYTGPVTLKRSRPQRLSLEEINAMRYYRCMSIPLIGAQIHNRGSVRFIEDLPSICIKHISRDEKRKHEKGRGYAPSHTCAKASFHEEARNATVRLKWQEGTGTKEQVLNVVSRPSNLGKGVCRFFVCPKSGKTCRKLYRFEGVYIHREALPNGIVYRQQSQTRLERVHTSLARKMKAGKAAQIQLADPGFRLTYGGKATRSAGKAIGAILKAQAASAEKALLALNFLNRPKL